jgi:hypothetical protein
MTIDKSKPVPKADEHVPPLTHAQRSAPTAPLFSLGQTVATPGALRLLEKHNVSPVDLLRRHISGDWGDLGLKDRHTNNHALVNGSRLLSSYSFDAEKRQDPDGPRVWVITEHDRSVTTILRPEDY